MRRSRSQRAQAVVEMAIVLPVTLYLIMGFIGLMVMVQTQQEVQTALQLAAQSSFQADTRQYDAPGTSCCALNGSSLYTGNILTNCRYAAESFYGTMSFYNRYLTYQQSPLCTSATLPGFGGAPGVPITIAGPPPLADFTCDLGANTDSAGAPVNVCTAHVTIHFSETPIGFTIFWDPTLTARAEAIPPPFRQTS